MNNLLTMITTAAGASSQAVYKEDAAGLATISAIVSAITGEPPTIENRGDYTQVTFSPAQQIKLREMVERSLNGTAAGGVRVDLAPVLIPPVLKRLIPVLLVVFALGYIVRK